MKPYTFVDLDFLPHRDLILSGLLLKTNKHVVVLLAFDDESKWFDGIIACRTRDLSKWRAWNTKEIKAIRSIGDLGVFNLGAITTFASLLRNVGKNRLISLSTHKDVDSYYVAKVLSVTVKSVKLKLINKQGEFTSSKTIAMNDIDDLFFGTSYVRQLMKKHLRRHPRSKIEA